MNFPEGTIVGKSVLEQLHNLGGPAKALASIFEPGPATFTLPYPPTVNTYYRRVGNKTLISRKGREFRENVISILEGTAPLSGPLSMEIDIFPPDKRRRDIDNITKSLLDALQHGGVYLDDSQIVRLLIVKGDVVKQGKAVVRVKAV